MARANILVTFGLLISISFGLVGCTLYQSDQREALESNQGGIIFTGFDTRLQAFYECSVEQSLPAFVKEPLEVIDTEFESQDISVLTNPAAEPTWVVAYHHSPDGREHTYCKVVSLKSQAKPSVQAAVELSLEKLLPLL